MENQTNKNEWHNDTTFKFQTPQKLSSQDTRKQEAHQLVGLGKTPHHSTWKSLQSLCVISGDLWPNRAQIIWFHCWLNSFYPLLCSIQLYFAANRKQLVKFYLTYLWGRRPTSWNLVIIGSKVLEKFDRKPSETTFSTRSHDNLLVRVVAGLEPRLQIRSAWMSV